MAPDKLDKTQAKGAGKCPICKAPTSETYRPFCSKRCADIDLARWLGGRYAIAGSDGDYDEESAPRVAVEAGDEDEEN